MESQGQKTTITTGNTQPQSMTEGSLITNQPIIIDLDPEPSSTEITVIDLEAEDDSNNMDIVQSQLSQPQQPNNLISMSMSITQNEKDDQNAFSYTPEAQHTVSPRVFPNYIPSKSTTPTPSTPTNTSRVENLSITDNSNNSTPEQLKTVPGEKRHVQVARSYENIAKKQNWVNANGLFFPISVDSLCSFIRHKADTSTIKSIDWYVGALKKYHITELGIKDWDDVRKHPKVRSVLAEIEEEASAKVRKDRTHGEADMSVGNKGKQSIVSNDANASILSPARSAHNYPSIYSSPIGSSVRGSGSKNVQRLDPTNRPAEAILAMLGVMDSADEDTEKMSKSKSPNNVINLERRKRDLEMNMPHVDPDEPESFKFRYDYAIAILKSKYTGQCSLHPKGCFEVQPNFHLELDENMFRHWASLIASGDDVTEEKLPEFLEMPEFHPQTVELKDEQV
ncbi:11215_t:CDS:2 [Ambispora gerdemannii]|uniref:11215_t:CDS:1 n=1 Tax=Ambispora gerdemannii TaxID=144530 RepID=A0A9N8VPT2_9GLOM|nr:11215_t:CDS:2 [Ambispora gerdemannii]